PGRGARRRPVRRVARGRPAGPESKARASSALGLSRIHGVALSQARCATRLLGLLAHQFAEPGSAFLDPRLLGPDPVAYSTLDLAACWSDHRGSLFVAARGLGRVLEAPVQTAGLLRKHRTGFVGGVTPRDHVVPRLLRELVDELRRVPAEI